MKLKTNAYNLLNVGLLLSSSCGQKVLNHYNDQPDDPKVLSDIRPKDNLPNNGRSTSHEHMRSSYNSYQNNNNFQDNSYLLISGNGRGTPILVYADYDLVRNRHKILSKDMKKLYAEEIVDNNVWLVKSAMKQGFALFWLISLGVYLFTKNGLRALNNAQQAQRQTADRLETNSIKLTAFQKQLNNTLKTVKGPIIFPNATVFSDEIKSRAQRLAELLNVDEDPILFASNQAEEEGLTYFICDISRELMQNPIIIASNDNKGFDYELESAISWFNKGNILPATNDKLKPGTKALLNFGLKNQITHWLDKKIEQAEKDRQLLTELIDLS